MPARSCRRCSSIASSATDAELRHEARQPPRFVVALLVRGAEQVDLFRRHGGAHGEAVVRLIGKQRAAALPALRAEVEGDEGVGGGDLGCGGQGGVADHVVQAIAGGVGNLRAEDLLVVAAHGTLRTSVSQTRSSCTCSLASTRVLSGGSASTAAPRTG